ncbi:uncharacterized protein LOC17893898 isoform X2 [Capsella rubella]|uniref:uncharacterized protein LOC17893898 isoform X2 n=1 Tax=Capsella rubella TaxID=81985 RepID=UPI000CD4A48A|nr:uncharacterized protein LOC17893898 isoform X2 [Capsella rubella]
MVMEETSDYTANRVEEVQMGNGHKRGRSQDSSSKTVSIDEQDLLSNKAQKWFFQKCVNFSAVDSPSFKEALKEVQDRVNKIKASWAITGCSILLDAWVDQEGHDLVSFVADCPAGAVYLISFDVSDIKNNVTALTSLVNGLIEEVGVHNVTQIIASSTFGWVGELGEQFAGHNNKVFWSVSLSHCFELMLMKIVKMYSFGDILEKVKSIWEFINNNPSVLKIFNCHSHGKDITISSEFEFVTPYLTLESIFKAKKTLAAMFASSDWNKKEAIAISTLVKDPSFWKTVERVLKCTSPLIRGLLLFSTANNQHVGYIYDTMDSIKECIAREFNYRKHSYKPFWDVLDEIWNKHLHNPLHSAACHIQVKIATQLDMYRLGKECFNEASQADQISGMSPAEWWAQKASHHPELQSFAFMILSQTCEGASRYKLKRSLAEKLLLTEGLSHREQHHQEELVYVHYNLQLQQSSKAKANEE